ncbi:zinc-dependent metalloprotease [Rhodococcus sp. X156]|uniref:zinc-dependent metalloprotease n=1 Tax=Rhodococcus sp. X156 TaxID=2499145 RepID=UPI000FD821E7|nr:zinc-dependent metalloprotease [Rhodococcus sp. X156]
MTAQAPVVDWRLAGRTAQRLVRPGPVVSPQQATEVVAELHDAAGRAELPVRAVTGLADGVPVPAAQVLDRPRWAAAAATSMGALTGTAVRPGGPGPGLSGRTAGLQVGVVLSYLASAVLGQYDPFAPATGTDDDSAGGGSLLLVAPNVVATERALQVDPADFRLWVCLHEVTHRVQFTATPWLVDHMAATVTTLTTGLDAPLGELAGRLSGVLRSVAREGTGPDGVVGLLGALQAPPQREALQKLMALGTLLEGHADHVMDAVGPAVVPSVRHIRAGFDRRRARPANPVQRVLRALLGIDAKIAQYERGKVFVEHVVGREGMAGFNQVWSSAAALPVDAEITDPQRWINRVLA